MKNTPRVKRLAVTDNPMLLVYVRMSRCFDQQQTMSAKSLIGCCDSRK